LVQNKSKSAYRFLFIVTRYQDFYDIGGGSLLSKYNSSPSLLISVLYPDYEWLPWKFGTTSMNYWDDVNNQIKFIKWAGKELKIKEMSDWYNVTLKVEEI
jgi:hypothetical protein